MTPDLPAVRPPTASSPTFDYFGAIAFPFRQPGWFREMWWVFLVATIPVFRLMVLRGWRVSLVKNVGTGSEHLLPLRSDLPRICGRGFVLWGMYFLYWLPAVLLVAFLGLSRLEIFLDIAWWVFEKFVRGNPVDTFQVLFGKGLLELGLSFTAPAVYLVFAGPIYRAAMLRFALTGQLRSFFMVPQNLGLVLRHFPYFLYVYVAEFATLSLMGFLTTSTSSMFTAATFGLGGVVAITVVPLIFYTAHFWITGALFSALALRVAPTIHRDPGEVEATPA